jgi:poly-gamma-glutamate synthesis protein (capsule biosynthesis protein)
MHPGNAPLLAAARIDCCVLANNHVRDWGTAGLLETLETLQRAGHRTAGAGRDLEEARAAAILPVADGRRVLVFAFGTRDCGIPAHWAARAGRPGVHLLPDLSSRAAEDIGVLVGRERRAGDVVVASVHWGANWGYEIPGEHRRFARFLVDRAGVDVVHGHSSHHPKAIELYRGHPIFYGCGDFLNDYEGIRGHEEFRGDLVLMYLPPIDAGTGTLSALRMVPLRIRRFRLARPPRADRAWLRAVLDRQCRRFGRGVTMQDDAFLLERD